MQSVSLAHTLRHIGMPTAAGQNFFCTPPSAGRKITAGFTYLQRIGKAANFDVWFPEQLTNGNATSSQESVSRNLLSTRWAAIRQFELLQESGNHKIYDLDPAHLQRAVRDLSASMRAGGYRITVVTLGYYEEAEIHDELEILDHNLQERIAQMIHMLYLEKQSEEANVKTSKKLSDCQWDYREILPHIGMILGSYDLLNSLNDNDSEDEKKKRRRKGEGSSGSPLKIRHALARQFFDILDQLPQNHIVHDTVIGLQLPELNGKNQWNYIASPDETLAAFNSVLSDLFHRPTFHLRGYGDRITENITKFYHNAALSLS